MSQTLLDHFETLAQSQSGVTKLRGLILKLAVLGRLLPRESIWKPIKLGACVELISGQHLGPGEQNQKREGEPYITGPSDFGEKQPQISRWTTQAKVFAAQNDILLSVKGAVGRVNILDLPRAAIGRQVMAVRSEAIDFQYLYYFLLSKSAYLKSLSIGIAIPGISREDVLNLALELPEPLEEQRRIVAKVDELMRLCDALEQGASRREAARQQLLKALLATGEWEQVLEGLETLVQTPDDVDELRKAVLQLAVQGKLVEQDSREGTAQELLREIKGALQTRTPGLADKTLPMPENPYQLPLSWSWCKLSDLCYQITDGTHHTPTYISKGIPFLSVRNITNGTLDFSDTKFIGQEEHEEFIKRCKPEQNDVLLSKVGTTGIAKYVDVDRPFSIFVSLALLKFPSELLDPKYMELALNSPIMREQSEKNTQGIGNKNLVLKFIKNFTFPLPPLAEQHRIVANADRLMTLCDTLEAALGRSQQTLAAAMASAVAQAV